MCIPSLRGWERVLSGGVKVIHSGVTTSKDDCLSERMIIYQEKSDLWLVGTSSVTKLMIQAWFQIRRRSNCNLSNRELVRGYHLEASAPELATTPSGARAACISPGKTQSWQQHVPLVAAPKNWGSCSPSFLKGDRNKVLVFFPLRWHLPLTKCYVRTCPLHKQYWKTVKTSPVLLREHNMLYSFTRSYIYFQNIYWVP